jgi:hypothetical protein
MVSELGILLYLLQLWLPPIVGEQLRSCISCAPALTPRPCLQIQSACTADFDLPFAPLFQLQCHPLSSSSGTTLSTPASAPPLHPRPPVSCAASNPRRSLLLLRCPRSGRFQPPPPRIWEQSIVEPPAPDLSRVCARPSSSELSLMIHIGPRVSRQHLCFSGSISSRPFFLHHLRALSQLLCFQTALCSHLLSLERERELPFSDCRPWLNSRVMPVEALPHLLPRFSIFTFDLVVFSDHPWPTSIHPPSAPLSSITAPRPHTTQLPP